MNSSICRRRLYPTGCSLTLFPPTPAIMASRAAKSLSLGLHPRDSGCRFAQVKRRLNVFLLLLVLSVPALATEATNRTPSWNELLDRAPTDPASRAARAELIESARQALEKPIIRRAYQLADVGQNRTWLDSRSRLLEDDIRETFALAMSDFMAARNLADELPLVAAAYRLSGEGVFRERVVTQLTEMANWSPLQRPGWTLYAPGKRLPPGGQDGNWLGTGCGVRAITQCLNLMPGGSLDAALVQRLRRLLEREIAGVVDDWKSKRPWFVAGNNPLSNQWVLPTEGLIEACLFLGADEHREAYELGVRNLLLGVRNLLMALDAQGPAGEFVEGFNYASFTVTSLLNAAQAMTVAGDRRAMDHPFLRRFPLWYTHHLQPGDMTINCFDAGAGYDAAARMRPLLSLIVACLDDPVANYALANLVGGPTNNLSGLVARSRLRGATRKTPPLFAAYEWATRVNWRSSWRDDASGVWVRGGHKLDQHDHQDRGHVNYIWRGRPILIEAGTPDYGNRLMHVKYSTSVGHNVLQLGTNFPANPFEPGKALPLPGWQQRRAITPISVQRLDAKGGDVTVSCETGYDDLMRWQRRVQWRANLLAVTDDVALSGDKTNIVLFRWHLGTAERVTIRDGGSRAEVSWPDAKMTLTASAPILISQAPLPDNTLRGHVPTEDEGNNHTCVVVQSLEPQTGLRLETEVRPHR